MSQHRLLFLFIILSACFGICAVAIELGMLHASLFFSLGLNIAAAVALYFPIRFLNGEKLEHYKKYCYIYLFLLYSVLLVTLMFTDEEFLRNKAYSGSYSDYNSRNLNLIPFKTIILYIKGTIMGDLLISQLIVNLLGNFIAFMPMGLLLPTLFKKLRTPLRFFVLMTILICLMEIMQYFLKTGVCDIDDLMLNLGGACLTFRLWRTYHDKKIRRNASY